MEDFARSSFRLFSNDKVLTAMWTAVSGTELKIQISLGDFSKNYYNDLRTKTPPKQHSTYMRKIILKLLFNVWKKSLKVTNLQNNKKKTIRQKF